MCFQAFFVEFDPYAGSVRREKIALLPFEWLLDNLVKEIARLVDTLLDQEILYVGSYLQ